VHPGKRRRDGDGATGASGHPRRTSGSWDTRILPLSPRMSSGRLWVLLLPRDPEDNVVPLPARAEPSLSTGSPRRGDTQPPPPQLANQRVISPAPIPAN